MAELDTSFEKAAKDVANLQKRPSNEELLEIYGLYKQATVGDCDQPKPSMFQIKEKAKYESWYRLKGMSQTEAKQTYVARVEKLIATYGLKD